MTPVYFSLEVAFWLRMGEKSNVNEKTADPRSRDALCGG